MKKSLQIIKIASIFAGAVLGAGFAGGRELVTFFVRYGKPGIYGALIAGLLFTFFGSMILYKAKEFKCNTYNDYLNIIFGKRISRCFSIVSDAFLLVCFFIMLAGSGALMNECLELPYIVGILITAIICFLVLSLDIKGIGTVCSILTPLMLIGILYTDISTLITKTTPTMAINSLTQGSFIISCLLYVSYNMLSCAPALVSCACLAEDKNTAARGGITGGIFLLILSLVSCITLCCSESESLLSELPLLIISSNISKISFYLYAVVLYLSILTTAFSTGIPLVKKIKTTGLSDKTSSFLLCALSLPFSLIRFSVLIEYGYTIFGYIGLIILVKNLFLKNVKFIEK